MRVLIIPEIYRPDDLSANGTLNDAVTWVEQWLRIDDTIHVYWLLLPRKGDNYEAEDVLADRKRVTLVEAETFMSEDEYAFIFTESGYTEAQLNALKEAIYDQRGYVDIVVDQLRTGRADLYKWLLQHSDHRAVQVPPFSIIVNVHDMQFPFKYRGNSYRNEYQIRMEIAGATFADGIWFKAGVDADGMRSFGRKFIDDAVLEDALEDAVETGSPIDFSRFEEVYSDEPRWLHVAGSGWQKKHTELVMEIAETLHDRYGIRTVITSMQDIPSEYTELPWVEAYPNASREIYEQTLRRGDLAICASEYDTLARTWFEQAASGQVLIARDEPWIYDCVPEDYRFAGGVDELETLALWAVEHWEEAVTENRRMVEHVETVRDPEQCGRRTYEDMQRRVDEKVERFAMEERHDPIVKVLERTDRIALDELTERTSEHTESGEPITHRKTISFAELVFALRKAGFEDTGNPGTPVFERR